MKRAPNLNRLINSNLKTDPKLLEAIANAKPMTVEDIREQRVSWTYGQQGRNSALPKDQVREILRRNGN